MQNRKPGRPRDPDVERKILDVTLKHLSEEGYSRMSVDAIAEDAGVSKPTIYRRWNGKADMATAALEQLRISEPRVSQQSCFDELRAALQNFRTSLLRPNGMALVGTVLAEENHTPELLVLFRQRVVWPRREMVLAILQRAQKQGEISRKADLEAAVTMLIGSIYARYLAGDAIRLDWIERITSLAWKGLRD